MSIRNIARLRKEMKFTQESLARKANVSYHTVIKLESGAIKNPKIETVLRIAKALNVSIDSLIEGG